MTKLVKKTLVAIIVWQAIILIITLLGISLSYEPLDFFTAYLAAMWTFTIIVVLFGTAVAGIIYLIDG